MRIRNAILLLLLASLAAGCRGLDRHTPTPAPATASATAATTLTALPTHTESTAPTPSPTPLAQPCDHAYLPVESGATWTYAVSSSPAGDFEFTDQVSIRRSTDFTITSRIGAERYQHTWACDESGLTALEFDGMAAAGIALAGGQITLQTDSVTGLSLPAILVPGARWEQQYTLSGEQFFSGLGNLPVNGSLRLAYEVMGFETVSVPAGTFEALRIRSESDYDVRVGRGFLSFSPEIVGSSDIYLVAGIGMVKVETDFSLMGEAQHSLVELTHYIIR